MVYAHVVNSGHWLVRSPLYELAGRGAESGCNTSQSDTGTSDPSSWPQIAPGPPVQNRQPLSLQNVQYLQD